MARDPYVEALKKKGYRVDRGYSTPAEAAREKYSAGDQAPFLGESAAANPEGGPQGEAGSVFRNPFDPVVHVQQGVAPGSAQQSLTDVATQAGVQSLKKISGADIKRTADQALDERTNLQTARADVAGAPPMADPNDLVPMPGGGGAAAASRPPAGGPGGGGPARTPEQEIYRVGPQVRSAFGQADALAERAIRDRAEADEANGLAEKAQLYAMQKDEEARALKIAEAEKSHQAVARSYQEQADRLAEEASSQKIDSQRLWKSKGTAGQVMSTIGLGFGGFVQGATGGRNGAADLLEQQFARDIDEQKSNVQLSGQAADRARGLYSMALARFGDERAAEAATHQAYLAAAELRIKQMLSTEKNAARRANGEEMLAALAEKRAARLNQMLQYVPAGAGGGGAQPNAGLLAGASPDLYVDLGNGTGVVARSPEEARNARQSQARANQLTGILGELKTMDAQASAFDKANPLSDYNRRRNVLVAQAQQDMTVLQGQGAMSKGDQEVASSALAASSGVGRFADNSRAYDLAMKTVQDGVQNQIASQSGVQVREVYTQNRKGEVERKYMPVGGPYRGAPAEAAPPPASFRDARGGR